MAESSWRARLTFDAVSALLLLVVAVGGCYFPRYLSFRGKAAGNERSFLFQMGNMLSAGVMLSAGFCHLLADAIKPTEKAVPKFPLAPFLSAVGFLLTLTADTYASKHAKHRYRHHHHHQNNNSRNDMNQLLSESQLRSDAADDGSSSESTEVVIRTPENAVREADPERKLESLEIDGQGQEADEPRVSFLTALFLGMSLSLHSVLEGLALGAQKTIDATRDVLIAIAAHKGLAAYALGASLVDSKTTRSRFWRVAGSFSIASPIGIFLGFALSEISSSAGAAALSALASGTFMYVAMMEVIPKELNDGQNTTPKLIIMFLGFGAMSVLAIWA